MDFHFTTKGQFTEDQREQAIIELFVQQDYTYLRGKTFH